MSRLPDKEGVAKLRQSAARHRDLASEIEHLASTIRIAQSRLGQASEELKTARRDVVQQLEAMDCTAPGNHGYEARIAWMLGELGRQTAATDAANLADKLPLRQQDMQVHVQMDDFVEILVIQDGNESKLLLQKCRVSQLVSLLNAAQTLMDTVRQ